MNEYSFVKSRSEIPGWVQFRDDPDGFIGRGLSRQKLREAYQKLKVERAEIKKRPAAIADLKKKLKSSYDDYLGEITKNAVAFIQRNRNNPDIFQHFQKRAERHQLHDYVPYEIFEAALAELAKADDPRAIAEAERKKLLSAIEKEMTGLKAELGKVSPPGDFDLAAGEITGDIFVQFHSYWSRLQGSARGELGLDGRILRDSPEREMRAFYRLGLGKKVVN